MKGTNEMPRSKVKAILAVVVILLLLGFGRFQQTQRAQRQPVAAQSVASGLPTPYVRGKALVNLPKEGYAPNDTKGLVPGDISNGVRGLKKFYTFLAAYKQKHGKYPDSHSELDKDTREDPAIYGLKPGKSIDDMLANTDIQYDEMNPTPKSKTGYVPYTYNGKRPDGTKIGESKPPGTRDVLSYCMTYVHRNLRYHGAERNTLNPVGWYLVLWDDGEVQRVPYDQVIYAETPQGSHTFAFSGQAGMGFKSITYDQFYQSMGFKAGPRGVPGGQGVEYTGKPYKESKR